MLRSRIAWLSGAAILLSACNTEPERAPAIGEAYAGPVTLSLHQDIDLLDGFLHPLAEQGAAIVLLEAAAHGFAVTADDRLGQQPRGQQDQQQPAEAEEDFGAEAEHGWGNEE